MGGCQICHLLWCALLLQGVSLNVYTSDEASVASPSEPPLKTTDGITEAVNSTVTARPPCDCSPANTPNSPAPDSPSDINAPSDITHGGSHYPWAGWEVMAAMGGAMLAFAFLVSTVSLALRLRQLNRRVRGWRPVRTNVDLISGMGYPSFSRGGGGVGSAPREAVRGGHAEAAVKMEEVRLTKEGEETLEEEETAGAAQGRSGNGEASTESSAQTGTAGQSVASSAGSSKEPVEVLVVW